MSHFPEHPNSTESLAYCKVVLLEGDLLIRVVMHLRMIHSSGVTEGKSTRVKQRNRLETTL